MKLRYEENVVLSNNNNEKKFTINASAKAFKVLSSSLYSRKIEAIVRELSCNAFDSHVMAGTPDLPFVIHLPNEWEPEFSVEDFGIGLDDVGVEEIYTSYFTSTKTDSNDVIGALGLGSKTPFAYTDAFNVRTRKNGKEYTYTAFISASGEPSVTLLTVSDTTEPNGVKVTVPVKQKDFYEFASAARTVYKYFRVKPEINTEIDMKGDVDFNLLDAQGYYLNSTMSKNAVIAVMGNVAYYVPNVSYDHVLTPECANVCKKVGIVMKFEIGELDVAASRETISFDEETEKTFVARLEEIAKTIIEDTQRHIDNTCENMQAALRYAESHLGKWAFDVLNFKGFNLVDYGDVRWSKVVKDIIFEIESSLFVPLPVIGDNGKQVKDINGKDVFTEYNEYDYLGSNFHGIKDNRRSNGTIQWLNTGYAGRTMLTCDTTGKLVFVEGEVDTYTAAGKEIAKNVAASNKSLFGVLYCPEKLNQKTKDAITTMFGKENVQFLDAATIVAERKARLKIERDVRRAELGLDKKPKAPRIKKTQVRFAEVLLTLNPEGTSFIKTETEFAMVDLEDAIKTPFILFEKGASYSEVHDYRIITTSSITHLMKFINVHRAIRPKSKRDYDLLAPHAIKTQEYIDREIKNVGDFTKSYRHMAINLIYCHRYTMPPLKYISDATTSETARKMIKDKLKLSGAELFANIEDLSRWIKLYEKDISEDRYAYGSRLITASDGYNRKAVDLYNHMKHTIEISIASVMCSDNIIEKLYEHSAHDAVEKYLTMRNELESLKQQVSTCTCS